MRLENCTSGSEAEDTKNFAEWILNVGDGIVGDTFDDGEAEVKLSDDILIRKTANPIESIVRSTYTDVLNTESDTEKFKDKAILAPTSEMLDTINDCAMSLMPAEEKVYLSSDNICKVEAEVDVDDEIERGYVWICNSGFRNFLFKTKLMKVIVDSRFQVGNWK
ncbi:uncharacterized protein LOC131002989 [Salvia miltiorrhiza]|uniref:uncharacterized protein LOC131002989 n=1 Tax=Salvia miltiorrhiza TaxID=226208 RepID=UPI0025AC849D|nr:uncharacterized protein LOC131002989 [Salvia miltiorrhiza]